MRPALPEEPPAPRDWKIQRLDIDCTETNPIVIDSFLSAEPQHFEFDMHYCLEMGVVTEGSMDRSYRTGSRDPIPRRRTIAEYSQVGSAMRIVFDSSDFVTASEAARVSGLNRNALSRLFVEYTGMSFAQFALRYRVGSAAAQLRETEEPVKAIAANWGFVDTSHFSRSFVRFYGCAPTEYRRTSRVVREGLRESRTPLG